MSESKLCASPHPTPTETYPMSTHTGSGGGSLNFLLHAKVQVTLTDRPMLLVSNPIIESLGA